MTLTTSTAPALEPTATKVPFAVTFGMVLAVSSAMSGVVPAPAWTVTSNRDESAHVRTISGIGSFTGEVTNLSVAVVKPMRTSAEQVADFRMLSGLTTDQVARLFGVSRRSVHNWIVGNTMAPQHEATASKLLALVQALPGSSPEERRNELLEASRGASLFHQLLAGVSKDSKIQTPPISPRERIAL